MFLKIIKIQILKEFVYKYSEDILTVILLMNVLLANTSFSKKKFCYKKLRKKSFLRGYVKTHHRPDVIKLFLPNSCQYQARLGPILLAILHSQGKHLAQPANIQTRAKVGNTKGGSIIVPQTSCLTGLDQSVCK